MSGIQTFIDYSKRAYQKTESVLSEDEYNNYIRNVTQHENNDLFKEHAEEFRAIPLRDWIEKIQQFKTAASIKDNASVYEQLQILRNKYGELPTG